MNTRVNELRRRFGFASWGPGDVGDERVHFRDFRVREVDIPVWHVVSRRRVLLPNGIWLDRASWMQPGDVSQRLLLVESYECRTRAAAQDVLADLLGQFHVPPDLVTADDGRGGHAFVDRRGGDSLFVIGNVAARIGTGSTVPAPAPAVADHVRTLMTARPSVRPVALASFRRQQRTVVGAPVAIDLPATTRLRARRAGGVAPPTTGPMFGRVSGPVPAPPSGPGRPGPEGDIADRYVKVFSRNGEVRADDDDRLVFVPERSGPATLEVYDVHDDGVDTVEMTIEVDERS